MAIMTRELDSVREVTVVGAGTMGHGIAQTFATAGYAVTLVDVSEDILSDAIEKIESSLQQLDPEETEDIFGRISPETERKTAFQRSDFLIEAVPEDIDIKQDIFADADQFTPEGTILATNTSTLPISEIGSVIEQPARVVGMHFSNPVQLIPIVEVIRGEATSDLVFEATHELSRDIGKTPISVEKDVPGFLINRINIRFWNEALRRVSENEITPRQIDASVRRLGFPMGPFEVMDFSGIDVVEMAASSMQERGVELHIPSTLSKKVENKKFGMKTGTGFYDYSSAGEYSRADISRTQRFDYNPWEVIAPAVNEAAWLLRNDVTTKEEIDRSVQLGMNWPRGLLELADEHGLDEIVATLERLQAESDWDEYEPEPLLLEKVDADELGIRTGQGFYEWDHESETFGPVEYEQRDFLSVITLNRPDKLNALNEPTWVGLRRSLEMAADADAVRATVLRGAGDAFSAGDDIAEMREWESESEGHSFIDETLMPTIETLRHHPKPTIALVDGVATGAGSEITMLCDLAVASEDSQFGQSEATIGAIPPIWLVEGLVGLGKKDVMELALTGDIIEASEAEEIGLVNHVVSAQQIDEVARELARSTTSAAPQSVAAIKELTSGIEDDYYAEWLSTATDELITLLQSNTGKEGLAAFLEGNSPPWER